MADGNSSSARYQSVRPVSRGVCGVRTSIVAQLVMPALLEISSTGTRSANQRYSLPGIDS